MDLRANAREAALAGHFLLHLFRVLKHLKILTCCLIAVAAGCGRYGFDESGNRRDAGLNVNPGPNTPDAAPSPDAAPCDEGDLNAVDPSSGSCFMYFDMPISWDTEREFCMEMVPPAHLAVITTPDENAIVAAIPTGRSELWIGGNDQEVEMTWVWVTGEPMLYENWRVGEPDGDSSNPDCMAIEHDNGGTWSDTRCHATNRFICER